MPHACSPVCLPAPAWTLQEAIRLKEKKLATEVLAVTLGPASMQVSSAARTHLKAHGGMQVAVALCNLPSVMEGSARNEKHF